MKTLIGLLVWLSVSPLLATEVICVRNYLTGGTNTCESFPKEFAYMVNEDPEAMFETCTRKRQPSYCELSPVDFLWVISKTKEKVCTQRFDTSIINLCEQDKKNYAYIRVGG